MLLEHARSGPWVREPLAPALAREMALVGGLLYATGGLLGLLTVVLPAWQGLHRGWVAGIAAVAIAVGAALLWSAGRVRLPPMLFVVAAGLGSVLITMAVWFGGGRGAAVFGVLYVFVAAFAFYYFPRWIAVSEIAVVAAGYALALAVRGDGGAFTQWLVVVGASAAGGALIGSLGQRNRALLVAEQATAAALEDIDRWRTTFLQAVAHDLRAPLSAVIGSLATLRDPGDRLPPDQRDEMLVHALSGAQRIRRILDDLLDMERIAAGDIRPRLQPTPLDQLVRSAIHNVDLDQHHINVSTEPVDVPVEAPKVERIIENLVANACRHTPPGTHVYVRVQRHSGGALLTVEDDGPGIPERVKASLFQPFHRGRPEHPVAHGSTGLGLALVARFTELHGGSVWVEDRPGGGACFRVLLPGTPEPSQR